MPTTTVTHRPYLLYTQPLNGSDNFRVNQNIVLRFFRDEITAGSGHIIISNGLDTRTININDTEQVAFKSDNKVIINPKEDLIPDTTYNIQMMRGVIVDLNGNAFAGINDETPLHFTTVADTFSPRLVYSTPRDKEGNFKIDDDISLFFDETVTAGSGYIVISNGADTRTIDIHDASQATFDENKVTINPTNDLVVNTTYNVQIASGVIMDTADHAYDGFSGASISTISTTPVLRYSNPVNNTNNFKADNDIYLFFDEKVTAGSGYIVISNGTDTRTIDIHDISQVTFEKNESSFYSDGLVIINPSSDLIADTTYSIQVASGVIVDTAGHAYAGFTDASISTIAPDPLLYGSILGHNENIRVPENTPTGFKIDGGFRLFFDKAVTAGRGDIIFSNGVDTRIIAINDSSQVTFEYGRVTIFPTESLVANSTYTVQIAEGVIVDTAGNPYAGMHDESFTTIASDPLLLDSNLVYKNIDFEADDNITLHFDEIVIAGSGDIVISNGVDTRIIDISDTHQVTFEEFQIGAVRHCIVTVNPTTDLAVNTTYNIQMTRGVLIDTAGYAYAGINDAATLNFTTVDPTFVPTTGVDESFNPFFYF